MPTKQLVLGAFEEFTPNFIGNSWHHERGDTAAFATLEFWTDMVKKLDAAGFDFFFMAEAIGYPMNDAGEVPEAGRDRGAIEIDIVAGYGAAADQVPAPLRQAVLRLAARWFEQRGDVASRDAQSLPAEIMALIAPYRRMRL